MTDKQRAKMITDLKREVDTLADRDTGRVEAYFLHLRILSKIKALEGLK